MAEPKTRKSYSRKRMRRSQPKHKVKKVHLIYDEKSKTYKRPHRYNLEDLL